MSTFKNQTRLNDKRFPRQSPILPYGYKNNETQASEQKSLAAFSRQPFLYSPANAYPCFARSTLRSILPMALRGSAGMNSMKDGVL